MTYTITKIKRGIANGTEIPQSVIDGADNAVGKWAERELIQNNWPLVGGVGVDIPILGVEVKTRTVGTNARLTVGTMTVAAIGSTAWWFTNICEKLQNMYVIYYDRKLSRVTGNYMVNLEGSALQDKFRKAYEKGAKIISHQEASGIHAPVTCGDYGYFEPRYVGGVFNGSYAFRIPVKGWQMVENEALSRKSYENIFEEID